MGKQVNYQQLLRTKILNETPGTIARKLGVSQITAAWLKNVIKRKHQDIIRNEITKISTDAFAHKLDIPLELATWLKDTIDKEARDAKI